MDAFALVKVDFPAGSHNKLTWTEIRDQAASNNQRLPTCSELQYFGVNNGNNDTWVPVMRDDQRTDDWCQIGKHPAAPDRYFSHLDRFGPTTWSHARGNVKAHGTTEQPWRASYYYTIANSANTQYQATYVAPTISYQLIKVDFPPGAHNKLTWTEIRDQAAMNNQRLPTCSELQSSGINNGGYDTWVPVMRNDYRTDDWCQIGKHPAAADRYFSHLDRFGPTTWSHSRGNLEAQGTTEQPWRASYYYAINNAQTQYQAANIQQIVSAQLIKIDFPPGAQNKLNWTEISDQAASNNQRLPTCGELQTSGINNGNYDTWVPVMRDDQRTDDWCQIGKHPAAPDRYFSHLDRFGPTTWSHARGNVKAHGTSEQPWRPSYYYAISKSGLPYTYK